MIQGSTGKGRIELKTYRVRARGNNKAAKITLLLAFVLLPLFFLTLLFFSVNPFQTGNPLASEATIGQNVVGSWQYNGENGGKLVFYNGYDSVSIPADSKAFAADGEYIRIESHTPDTITYESALDAELINPLSLTIGVLFLLFLMALPLVVLQLNQKTRRKRPAKTRPFTARKGRLRR